MVRPAHLGTKAILAFAAVLLAVGMQATAQEDRSGQQGLCRQKLPPHQSPRTAMRLIVLSRQDQRTRA